MAEEPSLSHALAATSDSQEEKGVAQRDRRQHPEVEDLGWNERKEEIVSPLVRGLSNEDLWLLVRRFNKVRTNNLKGVSAWERTVQLNQPGF